MASSQFFRTALAAAGFNPNILSGTIYEFVGPRPRRVSIWSINDPPVVAGEVAQTTITSGTNIQVEPNTPIKQAPAAGVGPNRQDDLLVTWVAAPGDRIVMPLRNPSAANPTVVRTLIEYAE